MADENKARDVLCLVYTAMKEKGYNPIAQLTGFLFSNDPTYVTTHKQARLKISMSDRDDLMEELLTTYFRQQGLL